MWAVLLQNKYRSRFKFGLWLMCQVGDMIQELLTGNASIRFHSSEFRHLADLEGEIDFWGSMGEVKTDFL